MKSVNIVSYGAGVDSTAMILRMLDEGVMIDHVVFADTGGELPETYKTVKIMKKFLESRNTAIPLTTVYNFSLETLFDRCIRRRVFPDTFHRWCTRDFKVRPIHKFYKKNFKGYHINEYLGIDAAETKRCRTAQEDFITKHYPLVDWGMNRLDCEIYIADKKFPTVIKSGCHFCPYNSQKRWDFIEKLHPKHFKLSKLLERKSKHYPGKKLIRQSKATDDICGNGFS